MYSEVEILSREVDKTVYDQNTYVDRIESSADSNIATIVDSNIDISEVNMWDAGDRECGFINELR